MKNIIFMCVLLASTLVVAFADRDNLGGYSTETVYQPEPTYDYYQE